MKKYLIFFLLISVVITGCAAKGEAQDQGKEQEVNYVKVSEVGLADFTEVVSLPGILKPEEEVMISSKVSGTVNSINVDIGSKVAKGETICTIDDTNYRLNYNKVQALVNIEKINLAEMEKAFNRTKLLYEAQAISQVDFDGASIGLEIAAENMKRLQADYELVQENLKDSQIKAPIKGTLSFRDISVGETAVPGKVIFSIVNTELMFVEAGVSEENVHLIEKGQDVIIKSVSIPDKIFKGVITNIGPVPNSGTRIYPIKVRVENTEGLLMTGMYAQIEIITQLRPGVIAVQQNAVLKENDQEYVYVENNGQAEKRFIQLGLPGEGLYEVIQGLSEGEKVITTGNTKLKDGSLVEVVQ